MALEVVEWSSTEPDAAFAAINAAYGPDSRLRHWGDPAGFSCRYSTATSGDVGADRCITSMSSGGTVAPLGFFMSSTVISGAIADFRVRGRAFGIAQGATVLTGARSAIELTWTAGDLAALRLPWAVIDRVAGERTGVRGPVEFTEVVPVSAAAGRRWRELTEFVHRETRRPGSVLDDAFAQGQMAEFVAGIALVTFDNTAMAGQGTTAQPAAAPAAIRRAVAFIEANAERPITVSDVAEAARVSPRSLQYGFARHLGTTPMAYLRRVRLDRAHQELAAADPTSGAVTVAEVARRWGFPRAGRFAILYRATFDCAPEDTLNR